LSLGRGRGEAGHFGADDQFVEHGEVGEASNAGLDGFFAEHGGGGLGILGRAAMLVEEHLIVVESADLLNTLGAGVPFKHIVLTDAGGEEFEKPFGLDAGGEANERQGFVTAILGLNGGEERIGQSVGGGFVGKLG
jgi:hypothetical protein